MAWQVQHFANVIPAGTAIAAPVTLAMTMPARIVRHVRVRTPPGPRGNVGWQVAMNGVSVIPANSGVYIVTDNEVIEWDTDGYPTSGAWQLIGYNLGALPHTIYVTLSVDPPQVNNASPLGLPMIVTA